MADNTSILPVEKLRKVSELEEGMFMVETVDHPSTKKFFWVSENEVIFLEEKKEFWTSAMLQKQDKEKNGMWI